MASRAAPVTLSAALIVAGWVVLSIPILSVGLWLAGVVLAAVVGRAASKSSRLAIAAVIAAIIWIAVVPLLINSAAWVGRGFEGPDGGTSERTPTAR